MFSFDDSFTAFVRVVNVGVIGGETVHKLGVYFIDIEYSVLHAIIPYNVTISDKR